MTPFKAFTQPYTHDTHTQEKEEKDQDQQVYRVSPSSWLMGSIRAATMGNDWPAKSNRVVIQPSSLDPGIPTGDPRPPVYTKTMSSKLGGGGKDHPCTKARLV